MTSPSTRTLDGSPRYFFMHLQKTAGTALWRRLQPEFEPAAIYPGPGDGDPPQTVLSVEHLVARWRTRRNEIRLVTGHFPLCTTELLDAPFLTLTLLRHPVERTLSALRDLRERSPELRGEALEVIYDDALRAPLLRNHMVRMLSLTTDEMSDGALTPIPMTGRHLDRAQNRLATVDVIGFQEQFDDFCDHLGARFDWHLGPPVFMNRTTPGAASDALRSRVASDNAMDVALYEYARRHHAGT